jgi:hypothetical protein
MCQLINLLKNCSTRPQAVIRSHQLFIRLNPTLRHAQVRFKKATFARKQKTLVQLAVGRLNDREV